MANPVADSFAEIARRLREIKGEPEPVVSTHEKGDPWGYSTPAQHRPFTPEELKAIQSQNPEADDDDLWAFYGMTKP